MTPTLAHGKVLSPPVIVGPSSDFRIAAFWSEKCKGTVCILVLEENLLSHAKFYFCTVSYENCVPGIVTETVSVWPPRENAI